MRFEGSRPASMMARSARARAASTYVGSFINTSAWSGVFVGSRRAVHFSRSGASKVASDGGGTVRLAKVYMLRRYRSLPWLGVYDWAEKTNPIAISSHNPFG